MKLLTMFMLTLSPNKFFTHAILKKQPVMKQPKTEDHPVYFSSFLHSQSQVK